MSRPLRACLIANRGEIACRVIRACRELGIRAVAVYADVDRHALHVRMADRAAAIGRAEERPYLDGARLIRAALEMGCDCVHPGYGFLSENDEFARAVTDAGLVWIGPPPAAIRAMGVKTEARALMEKAGVPLVPGFHGTEDTAPDGWLRAAGSIGYPVMVKAAGGGGGKGIRIVHRPDELLAAVETARREAAHAFGDSRVFLEKYIEGARHIEVQVLADSHSRVVHLYERECSLQRRHQKVIEESPAPGLNDVTRASMGQAAVSAARAVGYVSAGTVEFIVAPAGDFYFLEMNTRLQVEHPVTEWVTGVDLVRLQFEIAAGGELPFAQDEITQRGHAVECRLYAEDARSGFLPATGVVQYFRPPSGANVRVDTGITSGDAITVHFDPLIAKLIVYGRTRLEALDRLRAALRETVVLGTETNLAFLQRLAGHPAFTAGVVDTTFIETHLGELLPPESAPPDLALIGAALTDMHRAAARAVSSDGAVAAAADPWDRADGYRIGVRRA